MKRYTNGIITTGLHVTEATPLDDRIHYNTLADLVVSVEAADQATLTTLFDGIVVVISDSGKSYIWVESAWGALPTGHTYPPYAVDVRGQNYANKTYNFVLFDKVAKYSASYSSTADEGLVIHKNELPYEVLKDPDGAIVTLKSSTTFFQEIEIPDRVAVRADHIVILLDPKPAINEEFKITLQ